MNTINKASPPVRGILVSDFDGTITLRDFYDLVREQWPLPPDNDPWDHYVTGQITHFEALARIFGRLRTDEPTLLRLVNRMGLDPRMKQAVENLRARGWDVIVASAGCSWYIQYLFSQAGVNLEVHSNPGKFENGALRMSLPQDSRFFSPTTGISKIAVVKDALARCATVAFAGDGRPDLESALLVKPELRFARGWLAEELRQRKEVFHPFNHWSEVADKLLQIHADA
ncbi:MAG TPA: MtnX-like HAD-IB family phosphatase [Candidatus Paceibacterota bacterium]|nr:MtnX-like HAD-IB family phosphatase [Candidatus Paceibacterota bacterium]